MTQLLHNNQYLKVNGKMSQKISHDLLAFVSLPSFTWYK